MAKRYFYSSLQKSIQFLGNQRKQAAFWLLGAICSSIIGTIINAIGPRIVLEATKTIPILGIVLYTIVIFTIIVVTYIIIQYRSKVTELQAEIDNSNRVYQQVAALDDTLLVLLSQLASSENLTKAMKILLENVLQLTASILSENVSRASILIPDKKHEYLNQWAVFRMPPETLRFYIGEESNKKRGVAGKAFTENKFYLVHILKNKKRGWQADDPDYFRAHRRNHPTYKSFVVIPIGTSKCEGVICFDSSHEDTFDAPGMQSLLEAFGKKFTSAIYVYEELNKRNNKVTDAGFNKPIENQPELGHNSDATLKSSTSRRNGQPFRHRKDVPKSERMNT